MEQPINISMALEDYEEIEKIFNRTDDPKFSVVGKIRLSEDTVMVSIIAHSPMYIWFLAKEVQMMQDHNKRMDELFKKLNSNT